MQAGLLARKVGMTQIFNESGTILPVTILKTGLCQISQIKTVTTDGYNAVQVAYGEKKIRKYKQTNKRSFKKSW
jgi:large subunit ribosomal protein L3